MIKTINLQKIFKTEEVETWALNNVSIEVKQGEFVAIMGPSGCGKSTLLNILGLLDNPTGGEYYLNGMEVSKYTESQRSIWVSQLPNVKREWRLPWNEWLLLIVANISPNNCQVVSSNVSLSPVQ